MEKKKPQQRRSLEILRSNLDRKGNMIRSGSLFALLTLASRFLGLIRVRAQATLLGTTSLGDAFNAAFIVPNLLRRLFAENTMSVAFVPTFRRYLVEGRLAEVKHFISAVCTVLGFLTTVVVALGMVGTPLIMSLLQHQSVEASQLGRIMFPYLIAISLAALFQGLLNSMKIFGPSSFVPILFNLSFIGFGYLGGWLFDAPAHGMAWGVLIGGVIQALFQLPFVWRMGFRFSLVSLPAAFRHPGVLRIFRLIGPTIVGTSAYLLNATLSSALAGFAGEGVLSALNISLRLQELVLGVFAVSVGTVMLPNLSGLVTKGDWKGFVKTALRGVETIILITIPVSLFSLVYGYDIVSFLFLGGVFTAESAQMTTEVFYFHIVGLPWIAVNRVLSPAFYALGNTRLPTLAGVLALAFNGALSLILVFPLGGPGIAFALSASALLNSLLLFAFLPRLATKKPGLQLGTITAPTALYGLRVCLSALPSLALAHWVIRPLVADGTQALAPVWGSFLQLVVGSVAFFGIFLLVVVLTKEERSRALLASALQKLRRSGGQP